MSEVSDSVFAAEEARDTVYGDLNDPADRIILKLARAMCNAIDDRKHYPCVYCRETNYTWDEVLQENFPTGCPEGCGGIGYYDIAKEVVERLAADGIAVGLASKAQA